MRTGDFLTGFFTQIKKDLSDPTQDIHSGKLSFPYGGTDQHQDFAAARWNLGSSAKLLSSEL